MTIRKEQRHPLPKQQLKNFLEGKSSKLCPFPHAGAVPTDDAPWSELVGRFEIPALLHD
jgi:hypothetical protein